MSFKIMPFGGQQYPGDYADHTDIHQYLGFKPYEKMPADYSNHTRVPLTDNRTVSLHVNKGTVSEIGWRGKSSKHRCFVCCPDCDVSVPAGRTTQHKCKGN